VVQLKPLPAITATFICLFILKQPAGAILISYDDLWDISQGSVVTEHSRVWSVHSMWSPPLRGSDIRNMFGGYYGYPWPGENTALGRNTSAGTIHWVEWQTPSLITLRSFNLITMHDPPPKDIRKRGFSQFRLYWAVASGGPWTLLYELADTDPDGDLYYGGGPTYPERHYLELAVNVVPTTAQYWRAEFVQYANTGYYDAGVRVIELDGYDTFLAPSNLSPVANAGPDQTIEQESYAGTEVTLDGSGSTDPDSTEGTNDDIVSFDWYEGPTLLGTGEQLQYTFPLGEHTVTLVVTDSCGETDADEVIIIVEDTTPPTINRISANPDVLWPPNHKMVEVTVSVDVEDICDPEPFCWILGVSCDEPINGPGDGNTEPDWDYTDDPLVVLLRAERAGDGDGRKYTIDIVCEDASGNITTETVDVIVPHDQGKGKKK
jgi:hypothetical protein